LEAGYLFGFDRILVHREPDTGGATFIAKIAQRLKELNFSGEAYEFSIDGFKDPSELHCDDPERFKDRFEDALNHTTVPNLQPGFNGVNQVNDDNPWGQAKSASEFVNEGETEVEYIARNLLVRSGVTVWASPRGLGKTHVALALARAVAVGGQ